MGLSGHNILVLSEKPPIFKALIYPLQFGHIESVELPDLHTIDVPSQGTWLANNLVITRDTSQRTLTQRKEDFHEFQDFYMTRTETGTWW